MVNKELQIDKGGLLNAETRLRTAGAETQRRKCAEEWKAIAMVAGTSLFALLCGAK